MIGKTPKRAAGLDDGLYLIETFDPWTPALHRVAVGYLERFGGSGFWIDALDNTKLFTHPESPRDLPVAMRLRRAFNAYEHHEIVRTLPDDLHPSTGLVVLPCITSLYEKPEIPDWEGRWYFESTLSILAEAADVVDVPILATGVVGGDFLELARSTAAVTTAIEQTDQGYRFEREAFETAVRWEPGGLQTTFPEWNGPEHRSDEPMSTEELADSGFFPKTI